MKRYRWIPWGIALFLILVACQSPPTLNTTYVSSPSEYQAAAHARKALIEKIRNKKPYLGPVRISLNQDLLENSSKSQSLDLTAKLNESFFHTQSLPSGTAIYQETFVTSQQTSENRREFSIASTYKRYTLHAQRFGQGGEVKVLINGEQWFKDSDFDKNGEAERPGLLLNTKNSLLVNLDGQPGTSLTITVVEGGDAGTVLRQRGQLGMPGEKQSDHVRQGDINIFDPYDLNSLGGLTPYQGDISTPASGSSRAIRISGLRANELPITRFESGVLVLKFKDPQVGLEVLKDHYGAQVMDQVDEFYYLSLDLTTSPIERIVELIHGYNQHSDGDIESIAFSSLASMQTYAIALDVLMRFPNQLESLDFNQVGIPPAVFDDLTVTHNGSGGVSSIQDCNGQPANSWWLTQTNTDKAWDLSIGTGVKVAWIDRGYDFSANGVDLDARRLKFNLSSLNKNESYISDSVSDNFGNNPNPSYVECAKYHAQCAMMTGFAERDNTKQTVGVAPNVTVIPFKIGAGDYAKALREARTIGADVIGLNMGWPKSIGGYFMFAGDSIVGTFGGDSIKDQIIQSIKDGRPVIMAAHNYHQSLNDWMIVDLLDDHLTGNDAYLKQLIVVGNATPLKDKTIASVPCPPSPNPMPNPTPPAPPLGMYAYYSIVYDGLPWYAEKNGAGSNYGPNMIWAPGDSIYIANRPNSPYFSSNPMISFGGTSAATPFVTGVVALMKSRYPGLQPNRVKEILLSSKAQAIVPNPGMARAGISAYLLDVEQAVRTAALEANPNFATAKTYYAYVTQGPSPTGRQLRLNQFAQNTAPIPPNAAALERIKSMEEQTVSQSVWDAKLKPGMYLRVTGWSNVLAGRIGGNNRTFGIEDIEILDADAICDDTSQGACASPPLIFEPRISQIDFAPLTGSTPPGFIPKAADGFIMTFTGTNLLANLKDGFDQARFTVNFQPLLGGNPTVGFSSVAIPSLDVIEVSNEGTLVKVRINPNKIPGNMDYTISLSGATQSGFFRKPGSGEYHIQSNGTGHSSSCAPNEQWSIRAYNVDDTATAYVNLNNVTTVSFNGDSGFIPIDSQLHPGRNQIRFILFNNIAGYTWGFQIKKNNDIVYDNKAGTPNVAGANGDDQTKPNQIVFDDTVYLTVDESGCGSINGLLGTVYNNSYLTPPEYSKKYFTMLDYVDKNKIGDQFGIGLIDYFSIRFDGKLTLPSGYPAGEYTLILGHDDGAKLDFSGTRLVDSFYETNYYEHSGVVQLSPGVSYPIKIEYQELNGEAELGLFWIKPDGTREYVPAEALSH